MTDMRTPITESVAERFDSRERSALPILTRSEDEESPLLSAELNHGSRSQRLRAVMQMLKPSGYANILLGFAPLGIVFGFLDKPPALVFSLNFLAMTSLSRLNSRKLARFSVILGPLKGGILYAIFDNAPLLILGMVAIHSGATRVAQSCILGSVLANLLLVMGWCFFIAGIRHSESRFSTSYASKLSSLMIVSSSALVVPSVISEARCRVEPDCEEILVHVSRSVSTCLLILFTTYLHYRLYSHRVIFRESQFETSINLENIEYLLAALIEGILLIAILSLASVSAYFMIKTLSVVSDSGFISERVASFVLLPIATDGPSRVEALVAAYRNEMPKALNFAISRSIHVALFVTPILVLFSWAIRSDLPMTLHFPTPETVSLFLGTILLQEVCHDGESDYLEGAMCLIM